MQMPRSLINTEATLDLSVSSSNSFFNQLGASEDLIARGHLTYLHF